MEQQQQSFDSFGETEIQSLAVFNVHRVDVIHV